MKHEHSAGAVLYTTKNSELQFVLVVEKSGSCGFPKGHLEGDETEEQAALREILEETNITADLITDFKVTDEYMKAKRTKKRVTYFAASFEDQTPRNASNEVRAVFILPYDKAMEKLSFDSSREILHQFMVYYKEHN